MSNVDFHHILKELIYILFRNFTQINAMQVMFTWCSVRKFHLIDYTNNWYYTGDHLVISQKVSLKRLQCFNVMWFESVVLRCLDVVLVDDQVQAPTGELRWLNQAP